MPQMAPVLWFPLLLVMIYILMWMKSIVYFSNMLPLKVSTSKQLLMTPVNWVW